MLRWLCGCCLCLTVVAALLHAESDPNDPAPHGVLVMNTGSVFEGRILKTGDDYEVRTDSSRMFVPGSYVKVRAESMSDAYDQMRRDLPAEGALPQRMSLAKWCVTHQLLSQARSELKTILQLDAAYEPARALLNKIDEILDPTRAAPLPDVEDKLRQARMGVFQDEVQTLAGLPKDVGYEYVRRVQPILMNNCALAGCHGPQGPSELRLQRVHLNIRAARGPTEGNLLQVLKHIDREKPRASPLLTLPQENHGMRGRPVFSGPKAEEQLATLKAWVVKVAQAQNAAEEKAAKLKARKKPAKEIVPVSDEREADAPEVAKPDPFDPEQFNRQP